MAYLGLIQVSLSEFSVEKVAVEKVAGTENTNVAGIGFDRQNI